MHNTMGLVVVLGCCLGAACAEEETVKIEVLEPSFSIENNLPKLKCKLKVEKSTLLGVEILRAGITRWTDDQGTNLGTKDAQEFNGEASVSTEGSDADLLVRIQGKHKPAGGAKSMSLEGELPVALASDLQEGESKDVLLKAGSAFKVGPYTFKIAKTETSKAMFNFEIQEVLLVSFTFDSPRQIARSDFLKELKFITAEGKEQPSKQKSFQGSFKSGGEHKITVAIAPTDKPLTVKWAVYGKLRVQQVPLKLTGPVEAAK